MHAAYELRRSNANGVIAWVRGWRIAALTGALGALLAVLPARAQARPALVVSTTMPAVATVGQTLPGSFALTNNSGVDDPSLIICDAGDSGRCGGSAGIILIPSCGQEAGSTCTTGGADPDVFSVRQPAIGAQGTACAGLTFLTPAIDDSFGKVRFAPTGGQHVTLPRGETCRVDFTFTVLKLPALDARPQSGTQTAAIVSAKAISYLDKIVSAGSSSIVTVVPMAPAAPSVTETDPVSPANDNGPKVQGGAPDGTTVSVYTNPSCAGVPAAQGTASEFGSPGLAAAVADDSTATFYATATDPKTALTSTCSTISRTYVEDSTAPETTIDSGPSGATGARTPVFTFSSDDPSASFACDMDSTAFASCMSPLLSSPLSMGAHTFQVWATDAASNADQTPASRSFTVSNTGPSSEDPVLTAVTMPQSEDLSDCTLKGNTITGTSDDDTLGGTAKIDIIAGLSGSDVLRGLGGRDCLFGGDGTDRLFGGSAADLLFGGADEDSLRGDAGNDRLSGDEGSDRIDGGAGNDNLLGGTGNDRLMDRRGTDRFSGDAGDDRIDARNSSPSDRRGQDRISCGAGRDTVLADPRDIVARDCETVTRRSL